MVLSCFFVVGFFFVVVFFFVLLHFDLYLLVCACRHANERQGRMGRKHGSVAVCARAAPRACVVAGVADRHQSRRYVIVVWFLFFGVYV